jgi:hypothetical protein
MRAGAGLIEVIERNNWRLGIILSDDSTFGFERWSPPRSIYDQCEMEIDFIVR